MERAEEAVNYYVSLFEDSQVSDILRYGEASLLDKPETIQHVEFTLARQKFAAMDSAYDHQFTFNEAISFVVNCMVPGRKSIIFGMPFRPYQKLNNAAG